MAQILDIKESMDFTRTLHDYCDVYKLVVLDFHADWCTPCATMSGHLHTILSQTKDNEVALFKINVDECPDLCRRFNVESLPTFYFVRDGQTVQRMVGANIKKITDIIEAHVEDGIAINPDYYNRPVVMRDIAGCDYAGKCGICKGKV